MTLAAVGLAALAGAVPLGLYAGPYVLKRQQLRALRALCARQRRLVLTYDDGPSEDITPPLLDVLAVHRARATFFLLGKHALVHRDVSDRIVREGHEAGCHSAWHRHPWTALPWRLTADLDEGYRQLAPWVREDAPYRPPHGKPFLLNTLQLARRRSRMAWWTIDSGDTFPERPPIAEVLERVRRAEGGVVLMHDRRRDCPDHRGHVLELTDRLLALARQEGLLVSRFSEL